MFYRKYEYFILLDYISSELNIIIQCKLMEKTCGICNKKFQCGGILCWCKSIKLNKNNLGILKLMSNDCVCYDCLSNLKNNE